jgi:hypothetical protein
MWMLWSNEVQVSIKFSNHRVILEEVFHVSTDVEFSLACVYGDPHHRLTKMIWDHISTFVLNNLGKPLVRLGDLNEIMHDVDTTFAYVNKSCMRAFNSYLKQCGLFGLGFSDTAYT